MNSITLHKDIDLIITYQKSLGLTGHIIRADNSYYLQQGNLNFMLGFKLLDSLDGLRTLRRLQGITTGK